MKQFTLEEKNQVLENPFIHIHRKLDVLLNIGKLLMECGANTNRIIEEMLKAATFMGIPHDYLNIHISYTTIMVNLLHKERSITVFRKTPVHIPNMAMINAVSKLTWRAFERHYSLTTYERLIAKLDTTIPTYPNWIKGLACALGSAGLAYLYSGDIIAFIVTIICSSIGYFTRTLSGRLGLNEYVGIALGGFGAMISAYAFYSHVNNESLLYVLVCCTLFMIPGVPLINCVIDIINNHILSGMTRAIRTLLIVGSMTLGMAMALYFSPAPAFNFVDIKPHVISIEQVIGSFTAAAAFAVLFNAPVRLLVSIGIGGVLCVCILRTLLIVGSMTLGMAMALYFSPAPAFNFVDIKPHVISIEQVIGSFTAAAAFAVLFNAPVRLLVSIGIGGVLCVCIRNILSVELGFSTPGATFIGAAIMSIIFVKVSTWLKTSSTIIIVPSAIALMPGILYYRFLFDMLHINALNDASLILMIQNGVTGTFTTIAIAIGVAIPNVLAQKYLQKLKEQRMTELLATRHINDGQ